MTKRLLWIAVVFVSAGVTAAQAQLQLGESNQTQWRGLAISMAAHGAASGFDAWTSWGRPERNVLLADGGRFAAGSAYKKAGIFAGASLVEVLVVKKWGKRRPWVVRACQIANFTAAGMLASAGVSNLRRR